MALIVKVSGEILDIGDSVFAINNSRPTFFDIGKRNYTVIKGLKFPMSEKNKLIFGYADNNFVSLSTARAITNVEIYISNVIYIKGRLNITGNDKQYYFATFTSRNDVVEKFKGYDLTSAINLHVFDTTTWGTLTNQQKIDYLTGNTDPAWILPFLGASQHPYSLGGVTNIVPFSDLQGGAVQDLHYNIGVAISEVATAESITINVMEGGSEVALASSNLYINILSKLFTPTYYWVLSIKGAAWNPPAEAASRITFNSEQGLQINKKTSKTDIKLAGNKNMWEVLVLLAQYIGFTIQLFENKILLEPFSEILNSTAIDYSDKLVSVEKKTYYIEGYEQNNYIKYKTIDSTPEDFAQLTFTQNVQYLKLEKDILETNVLIPGVYDLGAITGFFRINWDNEYSKNIVLLYKDGTATVAGNAETTQGLRYVGGAYYPTTFFQLKFYSPVNELAILQNILDEGVCYEVVVKMNILDYKELTTTTTIKIHQLGGEFIVEPFDYVEGKETKLKLIKIR